MAPCEGWIWLGDLSLLNPPGDAAVDPYAQYTTFAVLEFGASYGSGGIGGLVQPLIGEWVFGTLKPNRLDQSKGVYTLRLVKAVADRVGIRELRAKLASHLESMTPIEATRHGRTIGLYVSLPQQA